jgi:hypothetical protein
MTTTPFDKERVLDEELKPLLDQIRVVCEREGIPVMYAFAYRSDGEAIDVCTTMLFNGRGRLQRFEDGMAAVLGGSVWREKLLAFGRLQ